MKCVSIGSWFFAFVGVFALSSPTEANPPSNSSTDLGVDSLAVPTVEPTTSPVPVAETIRVMSNGEVIEEHTVGIVPTAAVLGLVESGLEDSQGYRYALTNGGYGNGAYGAQVGQDVRFQRVERFRVGTEVDHAKEPESAQAWIPPEPSIIGENLQRLLADPQPQQEVEVSIILRQTPITSLRAPVTFGFPTADGSKTYRASRRARVEARKKEMAQLQGPVVSLLASLSAKDIYGSFLTNTVSARLPLEFLPTVAAHPAIQRIDSASGPTQPAWDGEQAKFSGGENTQLYINDYWDGESQVAMVIDYHFLSNHEGFTDCYGCGTRVVGIANCENSPCTASLPVATDPHGTVVAGIVAGDLRDGQHGDTWSDSYRSRYTGAAEEGYLYLVRGASSGATARALDLAVDVGVDVVSTSYVFGGDTNCDGRTDGSLEQSAYEMYIAGVLWSTAAGNEYGGSGSVCTMKGMPDVPSIFTVGGLGDDVLDCTASNYVTTQACDYFGPLGPGPVNYEGTARGGIDLVVGGYVRSKALAAVDVMAPAWWNHAFTSDGGYASGWRGTSVAQPQVAGAAMLFRDWAFTNYGSWIDGPGATYVSMLAMTDRFASQISGFSSIHGGGRFQARRYSNDDHAGVWGWQAYGPVYLSDSQYFQINVSGTGNEPNTLNQFKVYAVFPEDSPVDVADIDLRVYDQNCRTGAQLLGSDLSYDVKSMVRLGPEAAGKALCVKISAVHVPSGETRPVTLFMYYSYDTVGR